MVSLEEVWAVKEGNHFWGASVASGRLRGGCEEVESATVKVEGSMFNGRGKNRVSVWRRCFSTSPRVGCME